MSALLLQAEGAKRRAATLMNERSSRAHSLLFLNLQQTTRPTRRTASGASAGSGPGDALVKRSQLCLGDLGGSEQVKKSGAKMVLSLLFSTSFWKRSFAKTGSGQTLKTQCEEKGDGCCRRCRWSAAAGGGKYQPRPTLAEECNFTSASQGGLRAVFGQQAHGTASYDSFPLIPPFTISGFQHTLHLRFFGLCAHA